MSSSKNAVDALKLEYSAFESSNLGPFTAFTYSSIADVRGENKLKHEIGYYGPWDGQEYNFSKEQLDLLVARTRMEVAAVKHLSGTVVDMVIYVRNTSRYIKYLVSLLVVQNMFLIFLLLRS